MKSFKLATVIGLVFLVGLYALPALAERGGHRGKNLDRRVAKMQEKLGLSDEQADKVYDIFKTAKENSSCKDLESFSERKSCRHSKKDEIHSQIESVLTDDQKETFAELKEKREQRRKEGRKGRRS